MYLFLSESAAMNILSFFVFTFASLTDWYDGWYARKYGFKTRWGQFLDPLADKILTSFAFVSIYYLSLRDVNLFGNNKFISVAVLVGVIIFRDIVLTIMRSYMELKGKEFKTSYISKVKTFSQMSYLFLIIAMVVLKNSFELGEINTFIMSFLYSEINYYFLIAITLLTLVSGIAYFFESESVMKSETIN